MRPLQTLVIASFAAILLSAPGHAQSQPDAWASLVDGGVYTAMGQCAVLNPDFPEQIVVLPSGTRGLENECNVVAAHPGPYGEVIGVMACFGEGLGMPELLMLAPDNPPRENELILSRGGDGFIWQLDRCDQFSPGDFARK